MLLAGMTLTSLSRIAKALDASRVRLLRRVGEQWVFAVFTLTLINGASKHSALWLAPLALMLAAYAVRLKAWRRASRLLGRRQGVCLSPIALKNQLANLPRNRSG